MLFVEYSIIVYNLYHVIYIGDIRHRGLSAKDLKELLLKQLAYLSGELEFEPFVNFIIV